MINRLISYTLPVFPKSMAGIMAKRYIAGETRQDAIRKAMDFRESGFSSTIDLLGEDLTSMDQAGRVLEEYLGLMSGIVKTDVSRNVSIKLSHFGLRIDREKTFENLVRLYDFAGENDFFIRIDMEDSTMTDATLELYARMRDIWPRTGTVLQARLTRTREDALTLAGPRTNLRLCKGIYLESRDIAYQTDQDVRASFLEVFRILMKKGTYVGIATHDLTLIQKIEAIIQKDRISKDRCEFQVLLGVPVLGEMDRLQKSGHKVRIYLPYGRDWHAYSLRRLKENPKIIGMVIKNIFRTETYSNAR